MVGPSIYDTLREANNYADTLNSLQRLNEAKVLLRKMIPVARRALGESNDITLRMRWSYAEALYGDPNATLDDLREAVTTLEDAARIARRVLGGSHPITEGIDDELRAARADLRARETPPPAGHSRDPSATDDATPPAPAPPADSSPDGSSGEAPAAVARAAEDPSS